MPLDYKLESVDAKIKNRIEQFLLDLENNIPEPLAAAYVIGPSARGEFDASNPEIHLLLVFEKINSRLLDHIAGLGRKYGKAGIRAPLLLTSEYLKNAADSFPVELFELKNANICLYGKNQLSELSIPLVDLRLQGERNLRSWRLHLRQA